jgi:adenylosuccinate lyase
MMALAESVGRVTAHDLVYDAAMEASGSDRSFQECLLDDERIAAELSPEAVAELTDPTNYTGVSDAIARRTVEASRER